MLKRFRISVWQNDRIMARNIVLATALKSYKDFRKKLIMLWLQIMALGFKRNNILKNGGKTTNNDCANNSFVVIGEVCNDRCFWQKLASE